MTSSPDDGEFGPINWPDEAEAVINDVKKHVRNIFISNALPSTDLEIYLNCETFEAKRFTIRLSSDGFQAIGNDYNTIDDANAFPYETPYALLNDISPGYISSFGNALSAALNSLEQKDSTNVIKEISKIKQIKMMLNMMEQNKRKIIAMAMQLCANSSSESDSDCDEFYRVAKRPKLESTADAIDEIPANDLNLIRQFCADLIADQRNFLRLDDALFEKLIALSEPTINTRCVSSKQVLSVKERLILTLSYLATARNYEDLMFSSANTSQTIQKIILETCDDLYKCLRNDYMKVPQTEAEWKQIASNFELKWQFHKCLGIVGGKHVMVCKKGVDSEPTTPPPSQTGRAQNGHNNNSYSNAILMAIVNDNFEFIYVSISANSRPNDSGIWESSNFNYKLQTNALNIPTDYTTSIPSFKLPYVFIGDKSFPLRNNLLRPFAIRSLPYDEKAFNYRLSRARRVIENTFAVLTNRFQCFQRPIALDKDRVDVILLAACTLHNFLLRNARDYVDLSVLDYEDTENGVVIRGTRLESAALLDLTLTTTSTTNNGKIVRNEFKRFFANAGKVAFQDRMIERLHTP